MGRPFHNKVAKLSPPISFRSLYLFCNIPLKPFIKIFGLNCLVVPAHVCLDFAVNAGCTLGQCASKFRCMCMGQTVVPLLQINLARAPHSTAPAARATASGCTHDRRPCTQSPTCNHIATIKMPYYLI
jgi:hypothetical protein